MSVVVTGLTTDEKIDVLIAELKELDALAIDYLEVHSDGKAAAVARILAKLHELVAR